MQQVPDKGKAAGFASQRADPEAQKESCRGAEVRGLEIAHQHLLLFAPIVEDRLQAMGAQRLGILVVNQAAGTKLFRQGQFGAGDEPVRNVIALAMKDERLDRDAAQLRLHRIKIAGAAHLGAIGQAEDKISEGELVREKLAHVGQQRL